MYYLFNDSPVSGPLVYVGKSFSDGEFWYKVFNEETSLDREKQMLEAANRARCPGIVKLYDAGALAEINEEGRRIEYPAIKEEFVRGETFMEYTKSHYDEETGIRFFISLAEVFYGLEKVHIIHNDIKPINIIVRQSVSDNLVEPVVIDFGIAKFEEEAVMDIHTQISDGFSATEKVKYKSVTIRGDICSFGYLIQFYMDRNPAGGAASRAHNYSKGFIAVMAKCTEENPENRYASFGEIVQSLRKILDSRQKAIDNNPSKDRKAWAIFPPLRRHLNMLIPYVTVLLYLISGYFLGLGLYMRLRPDDKEPIRIHASDPSLSEDTSILFTDLINIFKHNQK